ncbi:NAC domain-containing protein 19-like [Pyrus ussuriensis x Pyrus communis]|uniref:NAC domain-containing protein 19-like n=1 Tax=Pyrus ussuriensis x Pyrus communis TaxID=2448454 RepID=A0A5N5H1H9_9ROSA|nr:NAC domain-containing protein 19-like [Pyrus ussuriensis x Pyrus communis]
MNRRPNDVLTMEEEGYGGIVPLGFYENPLLGSNGMPLGFRFHPTDQDLISFFLYHRVLHRESLMAYCNNFKLIYEFDLFGKTPPWVVWENFGGPCLDAQDLFFFCQLKNRSEARIKREIDAGGTWSESNSKPVKDLQNEKPIGKKRNLRYEKEGCEHDGDWLLEEYSILPSVVGGTDDSDHEIGKVVLCRLKKNSRSRNKKSYSNATQHVNEERAKKRARKEVKEKPVKKRARKEANEKPAKTKARNEVGSQNTTSVIAHTIDESNYKMISYATNDDQQCISNIDGSTMPANFSDHDYVPISLIKEGWLLLPGITLAFILADKLTKEGMAVSVPIASEKSGHGVLLEEVDGKANGHEALEKYSSIGGCDGSYGSEDGQIVAVVDAVVDAVACVVVKIWKKSSACGGCGGCSGGVEDIVLVVVAAAAGVPGCGRVFSTLMIKTALPVTEPNAFPQFKTSFSSI